MFARRERLRLTAPPGLAAAGSALAVVCAVTVLAQNPRDRHAVGETFASRTVATNLDNPWDIAWGPDDQLWITERTGYRVTRLDPATGTKRVALVLDDVYQSVVQDGLLGMALHPDLLRGRGRDWVQLPRELLPPDPIAGPAEPGRRACEGLEYLSGKILRLNLDGSIPDDNPMCPARTRRLARRLSRGPQSHRRTPAGSMRP